MRHPSIRGSRKIRTFGAFCEARPLSRGLVSTAHPYFLLFDTAKLDRPDAAYLRSKKNFLKCFLFDWVGTVLAAAAASAVFSAPYAVKLLTGGIYQRCFVG